MSLRIFLVSTVAFLFGTSAFSQITVTNTQTPIELVENVLLGFGVTATNITVNGTALNASTIQGNITYFDATGTTFPIPTGVLLTTGNGVGAIGPNNSGSFTNNTPATPNVSSDPHLNSIANAAPTNGVVLEFDFVPAGDTISFNYIFGSDEYPEFSPSTFNDAFGFFLWGPGITGPYPLAGYPAGGDNLALIPGTTTPVTINNVGPGAGQFPAFYSNNIGGAAYGTAIQYDGTTVTLSANASVQCNQTYHIKLAISNVGDQAYDSGVFLQANSFTSEAVEVAVATVSGDTSVIEGCTSADLMFIRAQSQVGDTLIVNYTVGGTAIEGTDYPSLPNPVIFLPGEDTVVLTIDPIDDGIPDNLESVIITATTITVCGDTIVSSGTIWIVDSADINILEPDPTIFCANDSVLINVSASGGGLPYTYTWNDPNSQTGSTVYLSSVLGVMTGTTEYIVDVVDACGYTATDTVTITLEVDPSVNINILEPDPTVICIDDSLTINVSSSGGTGPYSYSWNDPNNQTGTPAFLPTPTVALTSTEFIVTSTDVCGYIGVDTVTITLDSVEIDITEPDITLVCPDDSVVVNVSASGGAAPYTYTWNDPNNQTGSTVFLPTAPGLLIGSVDYIVTATDACGHSQTDTVTITLDSVNIVITEPDPLVFCANDSVPVMVSTTGGTAPYTYTWNDPNNQMGDSVFLSTTIGALTGVTDYIVTVTDACGHSLTDTVTITLNQTLVVDTTLSLPSAICDPTGSVSALVSGTTGTPLYNWNGPGATNPNFIDATVWNNLSPGWYYFSVTDDVCTANDSVFVDVEPPPVASFTAAPEFGCAPLNVTFTNTSQNAVDYEWDFGGVVVTTASTAPQIQTFTSSASIRLIATDAGGCADTTYSTITVSNCGCTDPGANNYDPTAVIDDGSCFYPEPIIHVPNVFTPNGDNQNDVFFIDVQNATNLEFTILNRWGNVVYETSGLTSVWNGYLKGGNFAQDGTYFVKYAVTGIDGAVIEGHGFVQLVDGNKP